MKPIITLIGALLITAIAGKAQTWQALGTDDAYAAGYKNSMATSISYHNGTPYILLWEEQPGGSEVGVKKYDGKGWQYVGGKTIDDKSSTGRHCLVHDAAGNIYAAYQKQQRVIVKKYNGSTWQSVNGGGVPGEIGNLYIHQNTIFLSYSTLYPSGDTIRVLTFDGTNWNTSYPGLTVKNLGRWQSFIDYTGKLYVATLSRIGTQNWEWRINKQENPGWALLGNPIEKAIDAQTPYLAFDRLNIPHMAVPDLVDTGKMLVKKYADTGWVLIGKHGPTPQPDMQYIHPTGLLGFDNDNNLYLGYGSWNIPLEVLKYDRNSWSNLVIPRHLFDGLYDVSITDNNEPVVLLAGDYVDSHGPYRPSVKKYDGTTWETLGTDFGTFGFTPSYLNSALDATGTAYIAYHDTSLYFTGQVKVKKYDAGQWQDIYKEHDTTNIPPALAISPSTKVYIGCSIKDSIRVKRYNGFGWDDVGNAAFPAARYSLHNLIATANDDLYLAYTRPGDYKVSVKKYGNGTWKALGPEAVSSDSAYLPTLISGNNNELYLTYMGYTNGKINVRKYSAGAWLPVGNSADLDAISYNHACAMLDGKLYIAGSSLSQKILLFRESATGWELVDSSLSCDYTYFQNNFLQSDGQSIYIAQGVNEDILIKKWLDSNWIDCGKASHVAAFNPALSVNNGRGLVTYWSRGIFAKAASLPLSIDNHNVNKNRITLFPNPASDYVTLQVKDIPEPDITITDVAGTIIFTARHKKFDGGKIVIPLTGIPSGAYMVNIVSGNSHIAEQLIITR